MATRALPVTLEVTGSQGANVTRVSLGSNQTASLYLPTGSYAVTASQAGGSQSAQVDLTDGVAAAVTLNFSALTGLEIVLAVTAAIAVAANVFVWTLRSRGGRLRPSSHAKG